jgi:hypothetical protein
LLCRGAAAFDIGATGFDQRLVCDCADVMEIYGREAAEKIFAKFRYFEPRKGN